MNRERKRPVEEQKKQPSDEELWTSLIGIFESGDPHFAEGHDEIYESGAKMGTTAHSWG